MRYIRTFQKRTNLSTKDNLIPGAYSPRKITLKTLLTAWGEDGRGSSSLRGMTPEMVRDISALLPTVLCQDPTLRELPIPASDREDLIPFPWEEAEDLKPLIWEEELMSCEELVP